MISCIVLAGFLLALLICLFTGASLIYALLFGLILFSSYARYKNFEFKQIGLLILQGLSKSANILIIFVLIGFLTALWRASGTIPIIVYYGIKVIRPDVFTLSVFLINCLVSFLLGTAFGTASTVGVISMILAKLNGFSPILTGGAIISGIFFGDRCSPMSSSASLVASLTETDLYGNIKRMFQSAAIPFLITCLLYQLLGGGVKQLGGTGMMDEFPVLFNLHWTALLPAAAILVLSCFRLDVKIMMSVSIVLSVILAAVLQGASPSQLIRYAFLGYYPKSGSELMPLLSGGGLLSMLNVGIIVAVSSSFFGLLQITGLLKDIQKIIQKVAGRFGNMTAVTLAGLLTGAFSCNQTLATMLTCEICRPNYRQKEHLALDLENSVIVLSALIPWSIAGSVPLSTVGGESISLLFAFYLYLIPIYGIFREKFLLGRKKY